MTNFYICSENAAHIGRFYFMQLVTSERRVPDFIVLFIFTSVGECKVKEPTTLTEVRIEVLNLLLGEKSWNWNSWNPWVLPLLPNVMRWLLAFSMRNTNTSDKLISFAKLSIIYLSRPFDEHFSSYALFTWFIQATCQELDDNVCML